MWFFGNLYEAIVITPNLLQDTVQKLRDWQDFFHLTNPAFFYVPVAPVAVIVLVVLYFKLTSHEAAFKPLLKRAVVFILLALGLGIYIISQINFKLFFGDPEKLEPDVYKLAVLWNVLNTIRTVLVGFSLYNLFKAYILLQKTKS
jgi:hypothetical protein